MSMLSLFAAQPRAVVQRPTSPGATNSAGMPLAGMSTVYSGVMGRLVLLNAGQQKAWFTLAVEATYEFITFESRVRNGDHIVIDGRTFRVTGTRQKRMAAGNIDSYWKYPLSETSYQ